MTETRIAAITGGAGALGSALAKRLVDSGYQVALFDLDRSKDRASKVAESLGGAAKATVFTGDFAKGETWDEALSAVERAFGARPTHAALVAGGWDGGSPLHAAKDDRTYEAMMTSNTDTAYRALRALLPSMVEKKHGAIVVIGSRAVARPWTSAGAAAYAASKAAVVAMAEAAAQEVLHEGVRINAVLPSTMDTPANRKSMPHADASQWVSLESAAGVIAFLLSDEARDISGASLPLYGRA